MYLDSIVDSILKGLDQQVSSLKYNFSDSCIRVALVYFLVPQFGVKGYLCVLFFSTIFNATLSIHRLIVVSRVEIRVLDWIVKPLVSAALAVSLVILLENLIPGIFAFGTWGTAAAHAGVSLILYCSFLWMTGAFNQTRSAMACGNLPGRPPARKAQVTENLLNPADNSSKIKVVRQISVRFWEKRIVVSCRKRINRWENRSPSRLQS